MWLRTFLSAAVCAGFIGSSSHAESLSDIVRDREYPDLRHALEQQRWSEADLSGALMPAAVNNRPAAARLLLDAGADPNFRIPGTSVVVLAVRENSVATLRILLDNGGDPNQKVMSDWAPLHHAILADSVRFQALELLLEYGAEIDTLTNLQITPLHRAAKFCHARAVEALLNAGADPALTEKYGRTAYRRSVEAGCAGIGGLLPDKKYTGQVVIEGRKSHMESCLPPIRADNSSRNLGYSEAEITLFCSCTGQRYFEDFSIIEWGELDTDDPPTSLAGRRMEIETECLAEIEK